MCFTVNVNLVKEELESRYGADLLDPDKYRPSYYYHAFGFPELPAVCSGDRRNIRLLRWGLVPSWVKDKSSADEISLKTFNARSESIADKPSFSESFISKRCIIPVRGFFEWEHSAEGKIPWYIYRSDEDIMSLAGLFSEWKDNSTGISLSTFSIITTGANEIMSRIHNSKKRMPCIIERADEEEWLHPGTEVKRLGLLLGSYPSEIISAHTISDLVNRKTADRNTPDLIKPFLRNNQGTLF